MRDTRVLRCWVAGLAAWAVACLGVVPFPGALPGVRAFPGAAWAQGELPGAGGVVTLSVAPDGVGLGGLVRPGSWAPMRLELSNRTAEPREVVCRWAVRDDDGDRVWYARRATLTPGRASVVWLYAAVPVQQLRGRPWRVEVLDAQGGGLLASALVGVAERGWVEPDEAVLALLGESEMGLEPYLRPAAEAFTQHEAIRVVRSWRLETLPDRWHGLAGVRTIVWSDGGGDPSSPAVTGAMREALRGWVRRGGHLVIVQPVVGEPWSGSALGGLLPVGPGEMARVQGEPPSWLGSVQSDDPVTLTMTVYAPAAGSGVSVLLEDRAGRPVVVARRVGLGRVTLIGVDLSQPALRRLGLPGGTERVWNKVLGWQTPAYSEATLADWVRGGEVSRPASRPVVQLDRFVPGRIAMRGGAAPAVLAAALLFGAYWLAAGPGAMAWLRKRGRQRQSWLVFVAVVGVFTVVAWGGAWVMRPGRTQIAHFTVLTAAAGEREAHAKSWASVFWPSFAPMPVVLDPGGSGGDALASPGLLRAIDATAFPDRRAYTVEAADPSSAAIPQRATAKLLSLDVLADVQTERPELPEPWVMPQGRLRLANFWPRGELVHGLPGPMRDVLVVYCPGGDQTPWVWRPLPAGRVWEPGTPLVIDQPTAADRLVQRPRRYTEARSWAQEGFLGRLIGLSTGERFAEVGPMDLRVADNDLIQAIEMLSFYDTLPPPDIRLNQLRSTGRHYRRSIGRALDLTPLLSGRRLIVMGHVEAGPLPVPLRVGGEAPPATGWTVVRWVHDFDDDPAQPARAGGSAPSLGAPDR